MRRLESVLLIECSLPTDISGFDHLTVLHLSNSSLEGNSGVLQVCYIHSKYIYIMNNIKECHLF